jgi:hypothetical protein
MRLGADISLMANWLGNDLLIIFGFMQACNVVKVAVDLQIDSGKINRKVIYGVLNAIIILLSIWQISWMCYSLT